MGTLIAVLVGVVVVIIVLACLGLTDLGKR